MNHRPFSVYVLRLIKDKYYVGKSKSLNIRLNQHKRGTGSVWTQLYPVIDENPIAIIEDCDGFDEDKITLQYMDLFGIENVRGGSFCQVTLSPEKVSFINSMILGSKDRCYNCGDPGHFVRNCPYRREPRKTILVTT